MCKSFIMHRHRFSAIIDSVQLYNLGGNKVLLNSILATVLPLFVGLYWYSSIMDGKRDIISVLGVLSTLAITVHGTLYFIAIYFRDLNRWSFFDDAAFTLKYTFASVVLAILFSHIIRFIEMNMNYRLKVTKKDD